ncbi:hypothetical protein ABK040_013584 [Willaertia magna]
MSSLDKFKACMLLGATGDAIGYFHGAWEFLKNGSTIHNQLKQYFGSIQNIDTSDHKMWKVSDDTVMFLATAQGLIKANEIEQKTKRDDITNFKNRMFEIAKAYELSMYDMTGRAPGMKCIQTLRKLENSLDLYYYLPYDPTGGGCGGSMRSMPIGLRYSGEQNRFDLTRTSIESGRITHNHVIGFMGAFISALFTAYGIESIDPKRWGHLFINEAYQQAFNYVMNDPLRSYANKDILLSDMEKFRNKFLQYLKERGIENGISEPIFPERYEIEERDEFYKKWSFDGWAGSSGDDSCIIAYDALLHSKGDWEKLIFTGALHAGDCDSTGCISASWYGAYYGFPDKKYEKNWKNIEYASRLTKFSEILHSLNVK